MGWGRDNIASDIWLVGREREINVYVCSVYGPQEDEIREEVREKYKRIGTQVGELSQKGHVLILGDLNAKIGKGGKRVGEKGEEETSPNGVIVKELIEEQSLWSLMNR